MGCTSEAPGTAATQSDGAPKTASNDQGQKPQEPVKENEKMEGTQLGSTAAPGATAPKDGDEVAILDTGDGVIIVKFFPDKAPKHVENFKTLAKKGFYDGTKFHRTIPGFMIQGGDPLTKDDSKKSMWGTGDPGYKVKAEFNDTKHTPGILSAARSNDPDSAGSQFFLMHGDADFLDGKYTVYGQVVKGMDVIDKIVNRPNSGPPSNSALEPVTLKSVKIEKWPIKG